MRSVDPDNPATTALAVLSQRETTVLRLAANGLSDRAIAAELGLTAPTVRTYWCRIRDKFGAKNRTQAVAVYVRELGPGAASLAFATSLCPYAVLRGLAASLEAVAWVVQRPSGGLVYLTEGCVRLVGGDARSVSSQAGGWRAGLCPRLRQQLEDGERELDQNPRCTVCAGVVWQRTRGRNHPTILVRANPLSADYGVLVLIRAASVRAPAGAVSVL